MRLPRSALALLYLLLLPLIAAAESRTEFHIKAAFLGRFLNFIESQDPQPQEPGICVIGVTPIAEALSELSRFQKNERLYSARRIYSVDEFYSCTVLFIAGSERKSLYTLIEAAKNAGAVTVSDMPGFAEQGGMIELIKDGDYIRFIINRASAERSGIKFSAQLLGLAKKVI